MSAAALISRSNRTPSRPPIAFAGDLGLVPGRAHELCGGARHRLALMVAAAMQGPVLWIAPAWAEAQLHADGFAYLLGPERLVFVAPRRAPDLLWVMEEALRSGAVPLVVAELPEPPSLTPVRRLHLAAETGAAQGTAPLGLVLSAGDGGAAGVESRWRLDPAHEAGASGWRLARLRARTAPVARWRLGPAGVPEPEGGAQGGTAREGGAAPAP